MKDRKRVLCTFAMYDHTGIKEYLEKQAKEGWMLEKANDFYMEFRRITPKNVRFSVSYFSKASIYDPKPSQDQMRFQDFCEHTGWKHITSKGEIQIFYSEDENVTPIETDARIEVQNIHKTMKKMLLPYFIYMVLITGFQVLTFWDRLATEFVKTLSNNYTLLSGICYLVALTLTIIELVCYYRWRKKALKYAEEGVFIETSGKTNFQMLVVGIICVGLVFLFASIGGNTVIPFAIGSVASALLVAIVFVYCIDFMKRRNVSNKMNRIITIMVTVALTLILGAVIFPVLFKAGISMKSEPAYIYEYKGANFEVYNDEIPFRIEEFMDTGYTDYSTQCTKNSSVLVDYIEASQRTRFDAEKMHSLEYNLIKVKVPLMYNLVKKEQLKEVNEHYGILDEGDDWYELVEIDAKPWGANEVYQVYFDKEASGHYAMFFDDVIVEVQFDDEWELTDQQKAVIGETLKCIK